LFVCLFVYHLALFAHVCGGVRAGALAKRACVCQDGLPNASSFVNAASFVALCNALHHTASHWNALENALEGASS